MHITCRGAGNSRDTHDATRRWILLKFVCQNASRENILHNCTVKSRDATTFMQVFILYQAAGLLEISATKVQIVPGAKVCKPYATLSYSWGAGLWPWRTVLGNLEARMLSGVLRKTLPKTISDAVLVAERLDLEFLWVDALCMFRAIKKTG